MQGDKHGASLCGTRCLRLGNISSWMSLIMSSLGVHINLIQSKFNQDQIEHNELGYEPNI